MAPIFFDFQLSTFDGCRDHAPLSNAHRFSGMTGFVLAGGASRRMGRDKALLALGHETILQRQVRTLRAACRRVAVIGAPEGYSGLVGLVIPDDFTGCGPLAGIYTGLRHTRTEFNLFLGCDLPLMQARFLRVLAALALEAGADVTVPRTPDGRLQALCAVYRRRALDAIRSRLAAGENMIRRVFPRLRCRVVEWPEIARAGFSRRIFDNVNTPEDYGRMRRTVDFEF